MDIRGADEPSAHILMIASDGGEAVGADAVSSPGCPGGSRISAEKAISLADGLMEKQQKPRGRPFVKGQSGNPAGRPRKSKNNATKAMQLLLDAEAQALTHKAVELALEGNTAALRMCLDRLMVPRRDRAPPLAMQPVRDAGDLAPAMATIMTAAGRGEIFARRGARLCEAGRYIAQGNRRARLRAAVAGTGETRRGEPLSLAAPVARPGWRR